ncbi:Uncharacterised protein [uncultured archaeon]|nr:Uncharacterised protein [uncultured archaeon]
MEYPLDELIDKASIIRLKFERIPNLEDRTRWINEVSEYSIAIGEYIGRELCSRKEVRDWQGRLYEINGKIWDLESDIRKGKENELGLEEVGKRAIAIRNLNGKRVGIKSEIVDKIGLGYKDIKINHASGN